MKKTALLAVALATCLGYAPAQAADVVSSNIVGYEKIQLTAGYNMVGVQFKQVGGAALTLATVGALDDSMAGFDEDEVFATEMRVWNGIGYDYFGWSGTSGTDVYDDPDYDNLWLDANKMETTDDITVAGSGFWIKAGSAGTMTISGEVPEEATTTVALASGFNIVANPYPGAVKISDFGVLDSSFAGFDEDENFSTEMRVWNGIGYDYYGWSGTSGTDVYDDSTYDNKWLNANTMEPGTDNIPFGTAVWIKAEKAGNITFTSPITAGE